MGAVRASLGGASKVDVASSSLKVATQLEEAGVRAQSGGGAPEEGGVCLDCGAEGKGEGEKRVAQMELLLKGMSEDQEVSIKITPENPCNFLQCLLWHQTMQEVSWVKMKPVNAHGVVVPTTKAYRYRRGHVLINYPNKKVEDRKLWELAKKAVDTYILAGW